MENNTTNNLFINEFAGNICGIDINSGTFSPTVLIKNVIDNGGRLRVYNQDLKAFDWVLKKLVRVDSTGYDDGYDKNIDTNAIIKLNGISFEDYLEYYSNHHLRRQSSAEFNIIKNYEHSTDFIVESYTIKRTNTVVPEQPLEVKNCINMNSFLQTRTHNSLYVIVNSREENRLRLLCRLTKRDRLNPENLEVYGDFKVIPFWPWMTDIVNNYDEHCLGYSWQISRGTDVYGDYIEFISPKFSKVRSVY